MKILKLLLALSSLAFLAACSSTDEHGVKIEKKTPFFGSAAIGQTDYLS